MITHEFLLENFVYDHVAGGLVRRNREGGLRRVSGWLDQDGYVLITVQKQKYKMHRLVWLYHKGVWPICGLDHVNRDKSDNRIENLREATPLENGRNADFKTSPASGRRGVYKLKSGTKWGARINLLGKNLNLGRYETADQAEAAYKKFAAAIHGPFYRGALHGN